MKRVNGDLKVCLNAANHFYQTSEWCLGDGFGDLLSGSVYPCVVNASFTCELYLKFIMMQESVNSSFVTGHDLHMLFSYISENAKAQISQEYTCNIKGTLDDFLSEERFDFEKWRYAFEEGSNNVTKIYSLMTFMRVLKRYVDEKY